MKGPIWEGIYINFLKGEDEDAVFNGKRWEQRSLDRIENIHNRANSAKTIPSVTRYNETILPIIAGIVLGEQGKVSILDFGGGIGFSYYQVRESIPEPEKMTFHIVENESVCKSGDRFFEHTENIFFYPELPNTTEKFSIVHFGSSLQYIENWRELLSKVAQYSPSYIIFSDLYAGDIPTYASIQNYYNSKIPVWFFNVAEIIDILKEIGFVLAFKGTYAAKILGKEQSFPQNNFPEEYRLGNSCILLFRNENQ